METRARDRRKKLTGKSMMFMILAMIEAGSLFSFSNRIPSLLIIKYQTHKTKITTHLFAMIDWSFFNSPNLPKIRWGRSLKGLCRRLKRNRDTRFRRYGTRLSARTRRRLTSGPPNEQVMRALPLYRKIAPDNYLRDENEIFYHPWHETFYINPDFTGIFSVLVSSDEFLLSSFLANLQEKKPVLSIQLNVFEKKFLHILFNEIWKFIICIQHKNGFQSINFLIQRLM